MSKNKKIKVRRIWTRNPREQIVPNKKKKILDKKISKKDIEDFERGIK
jgi:hypothetical protein